LSPLLIAAVMAVAFIIYSTYSKRQNERQASLAAGGSWGSQRSAPRDLDEVERYHRTLVARENASELDERTWADLDMDAVFALLDRAVSTAGSQCLYHRLRATSYDAEVLIAFDEVSDLLGRDSERRIAISAALQSLSHGRAWLLPHLFLDPLPARPRFAWAFPMLSVLALLSIAGAVMTPLMLLPAAAVLATNIGIELFYRRRILNYVQPMRLLGTLIGAGEAVVRAGGEPLSRHYPDLAHQIERVSRLRRHTAILSFESDSTNELASLVYQYLNMFFLLDVNAFSATFAIVEKEAATLRTIFETLGTIDAAISVASFRASLQQWVTPHFTSRAKSIRCDAISHPLLAEPVANSFAFDGRSVLVTGSNMSGKSTFLRTIGVNAILAQTIYTAIATRYQAPLLAVKSSIGRGDDILQSKSYYLAEVERVGELLRDADRGDHQHLFIIDEIFRGTNTTERIAASTAVLRHLNRGDDLVFIATHDLELIELLGSAYASHHFRELIVDGELRFDYLLQPGASSTRNAIAILQLMQFPSAVVDDALATIGRLEARGA
jgi:hypothetical protein